MRDVCTLFRVLNVGSFLWVKQIKIRWQFREGTVFEFGDVFCFTDFLSGFLFRVRGRVRVKVGVGGGFRVRVRVRASVRAR